MNNECKNARSIRIFLPDGDPDGIRRAELIMSTTWAMAFKRHQVSRERDYFRKEFQRPGVYILLDEDDSVSDRRWAYIGESEGVFGRLETYLSYGDKKGGKPRWEDTIVLVSKDENLTKAHVRYIESHLIAARRNPRWEGEQNQPSDDAGGLPLPDRCDMEKFVDEAKMLVGVLGCDLFRPVRPRNGEREDANDRAAAGTGVQETFFFKGKGFDAKMKLVAAGRFVVQKNSKARIKEVKMEERYKKLRERLVTDGILLKKDEFYDFVEEYAFSSASTAASVVRGGNESGRRVWKLADGRTYGYWEGAKSDTAEGGKER